MIKVLKNVYARLVAWILTMSMVATLVPADVFADSRSPRDASKKPAHHARAAKAMHRPDVQRLTKAQMRGILGRGLRNPYLSGTMPWHRSFRDVNLCTGNLFKSFTDIQSSPAHGAGLVLQRTYNSNDDRIGPFGKGWTHAYDIRMEEASQIADTVTDPGTGSTLSNVDKAVRTDFFGGKHIYSRDADGLYTPAPYMHDWTSSDYNSVLVAGPGDINSDISIGLDGTAKHYVRKGNIRVCDYIEDKNGNRTTLTYDPTTNLLASVTDPSNRVLTLQWARIADTVTPNQPWRIVQVTGPSCSDTGTNRQVVTYEYGADRNLSKVHLDPLYAYPTGIFDLTSYFPNPSEIRSGALDRTTTYTYTSISDGTNTETGLLASITTPTDSEDDPDGSTVSYDYQLIGTSIWVHDIYEPGGEDPETGQKRTVQWNVDVSEGSAHIYITFGDDWSEYLGVAWDGYGRAMFVGAGYSALYIEYDMQNNVIHKQQQMQYLVTMSTTAKNDWYYYGANGNVLYHWIQGYSNADYAYPEIFESASTYGIEKYTYYTEDYYFQKASFTDTGGHKTTYGYGRRYDALGDRGNLLWVRDPIHQSTGTAAYTYQYYQEDEQNQSGLSLCGQKKSEANYNGVVTQYAYDDLWGNLTEVVQDSGSGHLNRTTTMNYNEAGQVSSRTDPMGYTSYVDYNSLGQPTESRFPAKAAPDTPTPAETVTYDYADNGRMKSVSTTRGSQTITNNLTYDKGCDWVKTSEELAEGDMNYDRTTSYTYNIVGQVKEKTVPGVGTTCYHYWDDTGEYEGGGYYCTMPSDDLDKAQPMLGFITDDNDNDLVYAIDHYADGSIASMRFNNQYDQDGNLIGYYEALYLKEGAYYHWENGANTGYVDSDGTYFSGRLKEVKTIHCTVGSSYSTIADSAYTYYPDGNRHTNTFTDQNGNSRTETYAYDANSRLTNVNYGDGTTQTYAFDGMGNRTSLNGESYIYNATNMLRWKGSSEYTYDADGNQLTGGGRTNIWDSQNRLVSCTYGTTTSTFTYGNDGLRRRSVVGNATTDYVLDGQNVVQELTNGVASATYMIGPRGIEYRKDESSGQIRWYLYDGLGSVIGELDNAGNVTYSRYDVYGNVHTLGTGSKHRFVGGLGHTQEDATGPANSGLIYMQARWMDPLTGRFISEDSSQDGENWYAYCGNNPVNLMDTDGQEAMDACTMAAYIGMVMGFCSSLGFALGQGDFTSRVLYNSIGAGAVGGIGMGLFAKVIKKVYKSPGGGNLIPKRIGTAKALGIAAGSSFVVGLGVGVAMQLGERAGEALYQLLLIDKGL